MSTVFDLPAIPFDEKNPVRATPPSFPEKAKYGDEAEDVVEKNTFEQGDGYGGLDNH